MALGQALKWGLVRRNEWAVADAPRDNGLRAYRSAEEEVLPLTDEQARLFFRATTMSPQSARSYALGRCSGARVSQLA